MTTRWQNGESLGANEAQKSALIAESWTPKISLALFHLREYARGNQNPREIQTKSGLSTD
jgi:hypothetical protein